MKCSFIVHSYICSSLKERVLNFFFIPTVIENFNFIYSFINYMIIFFFLKKKKKKKKKKN